MIWTPSPESESKHVGIAIPPFHSIEPIQSSTQWLSLLTFSSLFLWQELTSDVLLLVSVGSMIINEYVSLSSSTEIKPPFCWFWDAFMGIRLCFVFCCLWMHRSTTRRNVTPTDIPITVTTTAEGCFWELDEGITLELAVFTVEEVERATCFDSCFNRAKFEGGADKTACNSNSHWRCGSDNTACKMARIWCGQLQGWDWRVLIHRAITTDHCIFIDCWTTGNRWQSIRTQVDAWETSEAFPCCRINNSYWHIYWAILFEACRVDLDRVLIHRAITSDSCSIIDCWSTGNRWWSIWAIEAWVTWDAFPCFCIYNSYWFIHLTILFPAHRVDLDRHQ